jgi:quercetin dioxygenase-like cupin family protein
MATVSADLEDGHVIPEDSHPEDQLLFASEGVMTLVTTQGVWVVPPMRAVWIPAETFHSVATSGHVSMRTLYLQPKLGRLLPQKCFVKMIIEHLKAVESTSTTCDLRVGADINVSATE